MRGKGKREMADFATFLRSAREEAGLNQSELAERVGLTGSYISVLESRKKPPPSDAVVKRLADALGVPEEEFLEVAHLDRSPEDIRQKLRALDRHLRLERKVTKRLLTDLLPSSLWHFGRVSGFHEAALEKLRLDGRKKRILRRVLGKLSPLSSRDDFLAESRVVIEALPVEERAVLVEVLPELAIEPAAADPAPNRADAETIHVATADDALPGIEPGDRLVVDPAAKPEPGKLVLVAVGGRPTVRRALKGKRGPLFVAADPEAPPVEGRAADVLGVVVEIRRRV
jgi:transcriptional regulator with XRE-family HTH domain